MKQVVPEVYIHNCAKALHFYKELFGGEIKNLQMSEDLERFQQMKGKVIHSELHVNSRCVFYFVDILDSRRSRTGNITLMLHLDTKSEADRLYNALKVGGSVLMEMQRTDRGAYHAIVTDRFGAPWSLRYSGNKKNK